MKRFHIGDGGKSILCDLNYQSDGADGETTTFTRSDRCGFSITVTVLSVIFKDGQSVEGLRNDYREKAIRLGFPPIDVGGITYYVEEPQTTVDGDSIQFGYAAIENNVVIFSLNFPRGTIDSPEYEASAKDMIGMIESLKIRAARTISHAELTSADIKMLGRAAASLKEQMTLRESLHQPAVILQRLVDRELAGDASPGEIRIIGLNFGELLKQDIAGLRWQVSVDDGGRSLCLKYDGTTITIFPLAMVSKRIERKEKFDVQVLVESTIDTIEAMVREGEYRE